MSNFIGHRNAGIASSLVVVGISYFINTPTNEMLILALSTFTFSLFPDVDIKSTTSKIFYWCVLIVLGYCYVSDKHMIGNLVGFVSVLPQITKHRGILHHPFTAFFLPISVFYLYHEQVISLDFSIKLYVASVIGYLTHLFMDRKKAG